MSEQTCREDGEQRGRGRVGRVEAENAEPFVGNRAEVARQEPLVVPQGLRRIHLRRSPGGDQSPCQHHSAHGERCAE